MWQLPARLASFLGNMEGEKNAWDQTSLLITYNIVWDQTSLLITYNTASVWHQTLLLITYNIVSVWDQALLLEGAITWQ